jgi:hypothetical protein
VPLTPIARVHEIRARERRRGETSRATPRRRQFGRACNGRRKAADAVNEAHSAHACDPCELQTAGAEILSLAGGAQGRSVGGSVTMWILLFVALALLLLIAVVLGKWEG